MKRLIALTLVTISLVSLFAAPALAKSAPWINIYTHGDREEKRIAVTIDDWYEPELLPEFLDTANESGCKLTLYAVGVNLRERDRANWQRAIDEGHELGNHSNTHIAFKDLSRDRVKKQLTKMEENLKAALGAEHPLNTFRLPFGSGRHNGTRSALAKAVAECGYIHVVLWDIDSTDPAKIMRQVQNGSIILLHSNRKDLRVLKKILPQLKDRGYEMVTVSELLHLSKTAPEPAAK